MAPPSGLEQRRPEHGIPEQRLLERAEQGPGASESGQPADGVSADPGEHDLQPSDVVRVRLDELGAFIREQRGLARLSLRRLSELAGISNPYLSQIERGLRTPSAQILQQLARGLRISAETLYVQAGILEDRPPDDDLDRRILADPHLSEEQRQALVGVYRSFRHEHGEVPRSSPSDSSGESDEAPVP